MRTHIYIYTVSAALVLLSGCLDDDGLEEDDTAWGNFRACWTAMDEHYCFFREKGVDWDSVYDAYRPWFADSSLSYVGVFDKLGEMLAEVRDGHVNLSSNFNVARYWSWYEDYPDNFDENLLMNYYLGTRYWISGGMYYGMFSDSTAYIYYSSFADTPGESNLDYVLASISKAKGLIFDIRNNGGGALTNVARIANRFATRKTCYGYMCHKTGKGHADFSSPEALYIEPQGGRVAWDAAQRPVVILTNRHTFSAANSFVAAMRSLDGQGGKIIKVLGDRTGGGGGMPFSTVLPNGWTLRFSACPILDHERRQIEEGIDPDIRVNMDSTSAYVQHRDDIIEAAREYLLLQAADIASAGGNRQQ